MKLLLIKIVQHLIMHATIDSNHATIGKGDFVGENEPRQHLTTLVSCRPGRLVKFTTMTSRASNSRDFALVTTYF